MKNHYQPIEGYPDLVKDARTGMILNINNDKIMQSCKIREQKIKERQELESLKADVQDIKLMLRKLIETRSDA
jgi:hypothetical protein